MLNRIADRKRVENTKRQLDNFIAESIKQHLAVIVAYINTTNEIHAFIELAGKNLRVSKIRQMLHKTDIQCNEIVQQFDGIHKYIDAKLKQTNCSNVSAMNDYENQLLDLQLSLNKCEIHKKNRKSANLVRKIRVTINSLIEKIKKCETSGPDTSAKAIDGVFHSELDVSDELDQVDESFDNWNENWKFSTPKP